MNPGILSLTLAGLAGFILKTTLAFGICWVLDRIVASPNAKFMTWLGFLCGVGAYWLWLASSFLAVGRFSAAAQYSSIPPAASAGGAWQIPASWILPLGFALRALAILYFLVLGYFLFAYTRKQLHLRWVLRFACKPPVEIAEVFRCLAESLHVGHSRLLVLTGITSPATFGSIRPTILLPSFCLEQDRSGLENILCHELHHVRRWDFTSNGFAAACRALLFFHPLVRYAVRKMQFQRELACDLAVVCDSPEKQAQYAECLVRFARLIASGNQEPWGIDFAASSAHLTARVHSVLAGSKKSSGWLLGLRTVCGLALFAGFIGILPSLAVVFFYAQQQVSQPFIPPMHAFSHPVNATRAKARRKVNRVSASATAASADAMAPTTNQPEAVQLLSPAPDASTYPKAGDDSGTRRNSEQTAPPASGPSGNPSASRWPTHLPGKTGIQQPSVTSIIRDAASQISWGGDHDHDRHFQ